MKKHLVDWFGMCILVTVSSALRVPCQGKPHICSRKWLRQTQRNCCTIAFVPWMFGVNWKACNSLPLTFGLDRPLSFMIKPLIAILPQLLMFQGCMLMPAWNQCPIIIRNRIPAAMFWGQTEAEAAPLVCQNDSSQPIQTGSFLLDSRSLKFQDKALCAWIELWGTSQVQSLLQWRPDFKKTSARDVSRNIVFLETKAQNVGISKPRKGASSFANRFFFWPPRSWFRVI